jgi:hypothetical protein
MEGDIYRGLYGKYFSKMIPDKKAVSAISVGLKM